MLLSLLTHFRITEFQGSQLLSVSWFRTMRFAPPQPKQMIHIKIKGRTCVFTATPGLV